MIERSRRVLVDVKKQLRNLLLASVIGGIAVGAGCREYMNFRAMGGTPIERKDVPAPYQSPEREKKDEPKPYAPEAPHNPDNMRVKGAEPRAAGYRINNFGECSGEDLLKRMVWAEARNCSEPEIAAVAYTALNRAERRIAKKKENKNAALIEVILAPRQYSSFNQDLGDPNYEKMKYPMGVEPVSFLKVSGIVDRVLSGQYADPTNGATHYDLRGCKPKFMNSPEFERVDVKGSKHVFLRPAQRNNARRS